jgi:type IV secretion system protein VirD4
MRQVVAAALFGVSLLVAVIAATQWAGYRLAYHPALGSGLHIGGHVIYPPWAFGQWYVRWSDRDMPALGEGLGAFVVAMIPGVLVAAAFRRRQLRVRAVGAAKWGKWRDMQRAGLAAGRGIVVGRHGRRILAYDGPEHHLVAGASRSGKGVGHIVPTLLNWPGSAVVLDIKGELASGDSRWGFHGTAGWRAQFSHVLVFNPTQRGSTRFNPLFEVRRGLNEVRDAQNIAEILVDPGGNKNDLNHWDKAAAQMLTGLILHVLYAAPEGRKNLGEVRAAVMRFDDTLREMMETGHVSEDGGRTYKPHPVVYRAAAALIDKAIEYRSSVEATVEACLSLFDDPLVVENTAESDFAIGDLMCLDSPVTLYLQPPPNDKARLRPLMRLMVSQVSRALMERQGEDSRGRPKRHRLLLLIDEFPSLGRLNLMQDNMREMAGYGLKALLAVQSFKDVDAIYGRTNTIRDNCHVTVAFAAGDEDTAEAISKLTGSVLEYRESYSQPRSWFAIGRPTVTASEQLRPLLTSGEVRELSDHEQLVFVTGHPPFRTRKLRFYEEAVFKARNLAAPDFAAERAALPTTANDWRGVAAGPLASDAAAPESQASADSMPTEDVAVAKRARRGLRV